MEMNKDELLNRLYRLNEDTDLMFDDNDYNRFISNYNEYVGRYRK